MQWVRSAETAEDINTYPPRLLPYQPTTTQIDGEEFVELFNPGGEPFDLTDACFTVGVTGCFAPGTTLAS